MAKEFARAFYKSRAWEKAREAYMRKPVHVQGRGICPPGMCERCFARGRLRPARVVHHRTWLTPDNIGDPNVTLGFDNLMRVCADCHAELHASMHEGEAQEPRVAFTPDGKVMRIG